MDIRRESRERVKPLLDEVTELSYCVQNESSVVKIPVLVNSFMEFLYEINRNTAGFTVQLQNDSAEPQLRFDYDTLE